MTTIADAMLTPATPDARGTQGSARATATSEASDDKQFERWLMASAERDAAPPASTASKPAAPRTQPRDSDERSGEPSESVAETTPRTADTATSALPSLDTLVPGLGSAAALLSDGAVGSGDPDAINTSAIAAAATAPQLPSAIAAAPAIVTGTDPATALPGAAIAPAPAPSPAAATASTAAAAHLAAVGTATADATAASAAKTASTPPPASAASGVAATAATPSAVFASLLGAASDSTDTPLPTGIKAITGTATDAGTDANRAFALPPSIPTTVDPRAAAAITTPLPLTAPDFAEQLGTRMVWMAEQNIGHARINISPDQLGPVEIRLRLDGDRVHAQFISANADVRQTLEASLPRLRDMLGAHGFNLAQADVGAQPQSDHSGANGGFGQYAPAESAFAHDTAVDADSDPTPAPPATMRASRLLDTYA